MKSGSNMPMCRRDVLPPPSEYLAAFNMEAAHSTETSLSLRQTTWCHLRMQYSW